MCLPQESLLLFKDVYAVLMKMLRNKENPAKKGEESEGGGVERSLSVVDEDGGCGSEVGVLTRKPSWSKSQSHGFLASKNRRIYQHMGRHFGVRSCTFELMRGYVLEKFGRAFLEEGHV